VWRIVGEGSLNRSITCAELTEVGRLLQRYRKV
jgi:hypothetical protein